MQSKKSSNKRATKVASKTSARAKAPTKAPAKGYSAPAPSLYDSLKNAPAGSGSGKKGGFWKPKAAGDYVEGVITRIHDGQFNQEILTLRTGNGSLVNVPARREGILHRSLFDELQVNVGGRVCIIYDGDAISKTSGKPYHTWRCTFAATDALQKPDDTDDIPY
jgi:hypothetical protein